MFYSNDKTLSKRMVLKKISFFFFLVMLTCVREYNPFNDPANVKIQIDTKTFKDGASITIFSTETLCLAPMVGEKIDSFNLTVNGNIFWTDTSIARKNGSFEIKYPFYISFNETGHKEILITTYFSGVSKADVKKIPLQVYSPLRQDSLCIYLGTPCALSTPAVKDKDVLYHWYFGKGTRVSNRDPHFVTTLYQEPEAIACSLWVSDPLSKHNSQKVPFAATFSDTIPPTIICKNISVVNNNDTIQTADSLFIFLLEIADQGNKPVAKASLNDKPFSDMEPSKNLYWKTIENMYTYTKTTPLQAVIKAEDKSKNTARKTFLLCFDSTLQQTNAVLLTIDNIDSETVSTNTYWISGSVTNLSRDTVWVKIAVNITDTNYSPVIVPPQSKPLKWKWSVSLKDGNNPVLIRAIKKSTGTVSAQRAITIYLKTNGNDSVGPVIIDILFNDTVKYTGSELFFPRDSAQIKIMVIDAMSGVNQVLVNSTTLDYVPLTNVWSKKIALSHAINDFLAVTAKDKNLNETHLSVFAFQNKAPITRKPNFSNSVLTIGKTYLDTVWYQDPENDPVNIIYIKDKPWVSNNAFLSFTPTIQNIGQDSIVFMLYDGLQYSPSYTWHFSVIDSTELFHFSPDVVNALPDTLRAGIDQLSLTLSAQNGMTPYRYYAALFPRNIVFLNNTQDSVISWQPALTDTGRHVLIMHAADAANAHDSIYHPLYIRPDNSPLQSLTVTVNPDTLAIINDTINATRAVSGLNIVLTYKIQTAHRGRYLVTIIDKNTITSQFETDSDSFAVVKKVQINNPLDKITAIVEDKSGPLKSKTVYIKYPVINFIDPDKIAGCIWFDASENSTVINSAQNPCQDNDTVIAWKSKVPKNFMQFNAPSINSQRPQYKAGPGAVLFNQANNAHLLANSHTDLFIGAYTLFIIAQVDSIYPGSYGSMLSSAISDQAFNYGVISQAPDNTCDMYVFNYYGSSITAIPSNLLVSKKKMHCFCFSFASGNNSLTRRRLDGLQSIYSQQFPQNVYTTYMTLGACKITSPIHSWPGKISEVLIFQRALTTDTLKLVEAYFSVKYDIPLSP